MRKFKEHMKFMFSRQLLKGFKVVSISKADNPYSFTFIIYMWVVVSKRKYQIDMCLKNRLDYELKL